MDITTTAMIAEFNTSAWNGKRIDQGATDEVAANHSTSRDAGKYVKNLVSPADLAPITRVIGEARNHVHYKLTLPWENNKRRILSIGVHDRYLSEMIAKKDQFWDAVEDFCKRYPQILETRPKQLGGLFNLGDYPSPEYIKNLFDFQIKIRPVPKGDDFRVKISEDAARIHREQIEADVQEAMAEATLALARRAHDCVKSMAQGLARHGKDVGGKRTGSFQDSLVKNVREMATLLPDLNLTNDPNLNQIAQDINARLTSYDAEDLREDENLRRAVEADAKNISKNLADFFGVGK